MKPRNLEPFLALAREFEGLRLRAYQCPAGVWTIGYGATGAGIGPGLIWTKEQAEARLRADATRALGTVLHQCPQLQQESDRRVCAVVDFVFNVGAGAFARSTFRKRLLVEDWSGASKELRRWVYGGGKVLPGLVRRRAAEAEYIINP